MKKGLILEGGAMRGMFTAGVMDVLMENEITFDGLIGVSAGAVFGCNFKSGQIGRTIRYNTAYCKDPRYGTLRSVLKTGDIYDAEFCYHTLPNELDVFDTMAFDISSMAFYVVATDVTSGEAVYHRIKKMCDDGLEWMRASASMPMVSNIVEINGMKLLDGGVADSIPLAYFKKIGYEKNVVVLTQPEGYIKKKNKALSLMKMSLRKYPKLIEAMAKRHMVYNTQVKFTESEAEQGNVFIIRPPYKLPIGRIEHNPNKLREVYQIGRDAGEKHLAALKAFLQDDRKDEKH